MKTSPWLALLAPLAVLSSQSSPAAIFGSDDIREVYTDAQANTLARSTAMMTSDLYVKQDRSGRFKYDFNSLSDSSLYSVCKNERFADQISTPINCTGFLVAPDLLLTAGHCMIYNPGGPVLKNQDSAFCRDFVWIFDYKLDARGNIALSDVPAENVARCKNVVHAVFEVSSDPRTGRSLSARDFALIRLDRPVTNRPALKLATNAPRSGDQVAMIGYPLGLPAKYTAPARVADTSDSHSIQTFLDVLGGNSGSPVFNSKSEVVGLLVRSLPDQDFVDALTENKKDVCERYNRCDENGRNCNVPDRYQPGSYVQRISDVIPVIEAAKRAQ